MVFFIEGTNLDKKKDIVSHLIATHNPSHILHYDEVSLSTDILDSLLQDGFLGQETYLVEVGHIFDSSEKDTYAPYLKYLDTSKHIFVFHEYVFSKECQTLANQYHVTSIKEEKKETERVNPFLLTDYILDKDKKNAWLCLTDLKTKTDIGQIMAALLWAFKTLGTIISTDIPTESNTGIKSFVLSKMKQKAKKWSREEVISGYSILIAMQEQEVFDDDALFMRLEQYIFSL